MESKREMNLYPQTENFSPPNYTDATAPAMTPIQQQPMQQTYIVQAPQPTLGRKNCRVVCPSCHESQITNTKYVSNTKTHIIALILLATTCCCCIPYCIDSCKSAEHSCSSCGAYLGKYDN